MTSSEEQKQNEAREKVNVVGSLCRVRPDATPEFKQQFAKQFAQMLDFIDVPPGEPFYLVSAPMLEKALEDKDHFQDEASEAKGELEEKGAEADKAVDDCVRVLASFNEVLDDFERGIYDKTEVRDQLLRISGDVDELQQRRAR